ncbi:MAG TPA: hypothetical protein VGJ20_28140, partial [Xanthobacteraceae bacterium]
PMITHDGQISVARSLTHTEWKQRIAEAGISDPRISSPGAICDSTVKLVMSQLLEREGWTVTIGT